ncbi:MAG: sporulation protein YunB [Christensenellaceae bacterium]|jgi:sporulation protein YunB|nr:sporulation protein YunB [Christensenellaceae bacterium]
MRRVSAFVFALVVVVVSVAVYLLGIINPIVGEYARAVLETYTVDAVNRAMTQVVEMDTYTALTDIRRTASGAITSINVNMAVANKIAGNISAISQTNLDTMTVGGVPIPVGTFSGVPILVGRGSPIMLKIKPLGVVNCRFDSSFTTGGINQTRHKVLLYADTTVNVILPLYTKRVEVTVMMLFSESIIIGEVPQYVIP